MAINSPANVFVEAPVADAAPRRLAITHTLGWADVTWLLMISYDRAGNASGAWLEPAGDCSEDLVLRATAAGIVLSRHLQAGKQLVSLIYQTAPGRPEADAVVRAAARAVQMLEPQDRPSVLLAYDCLEKRLRAEVTQLPTGSRPHEV